MLMNLMEILKAKNYLMVMKKYPHTTGQWPNLGDHMHLQRYTKEWVQDRGYHKAGT